MKKQRFNGPMGEYIEQHLALRRSLGFIYRTVVHTLDAFDQHLANHFPDCQIITREMVVSYLDSTKHNKCSTRSQHLSNLRQFCRFMFQLNPKTYIPEKNLVPSKKVQINPHIFTEEEIIKLIEQAKKIRVKQKNSLLPCTYATIIGLLWVTGMRIGEIVQLKIEDVDTDLSTHQFTKTHRDPGALLRKQHLRRKRKPRLKGERWDLRAFLVPFFPHDLAGAFHG